MVRRMLGIVVVVVALLVAYDAPALAARVIRVP
jgi:hypothetical protein